ncbi:MAG TPA: zinc-ribbon domain containing protein [Dehalococcoidia bacterium]|nr:zinc-ribbon domain containing protein [Dehalococcoidia bacterium]
MLQDKTIICRDCGNGFIFTAGEQGFYLEKGLLNEPQRCPSCRENRRRDRGVSRAAATITCANCGTQAVVPFVPRHDRPVYCNACYETRKAAAPVTAGAR